MPQALIRRMPSQSRPAFTLVELLVVIGIIAVLVSILLPSLTRARQMATSVSCQANLRTLGHALLMYNNDDRKLPWGQDSQFILWPVFINPYLGGQGPGGSGGVWTSRVLQCPDAMAPHTSPVDDGQWNPGGWWGRVWHYVPNARLMPCEGDGDGARNWATAVRRSLSSVKDSSSKVLLWDGPQIKHPGGDQWGCSWPHADRVDYWAWFGGHLWADPPGNGVDINIPPAVGATASIPWTNADIPTAIATIKMYNKDFQDEQVCNMRYRHMNNTMINLLFVDGHVETRAIGELKRRDLCVNVQ